MCIILRQIWTSTLGCFQRIFHGFYMHTRFPFFNSKPFDDQTIHTRMLASIILCLFSIVRKDKPVNVKGCNKLLNRNTLHWSSMTIVLQLNASVWPFSPREYLDIGQTLRGQTNYSKQEDHQRHHWSVNYWSIPVQQKCSCWEMEHKIVEKLSNLISQSYNQ